MSQEDDTRSGGRIGSTGLLKIDDHLVDLIEGSASDAVLDLVAGSDQHRDARFEAEQAAALAAASGADFQLPGDFEARVMAAHDAGFHGVPTSELAARGSEGAVPPPPQTLPILEPGAESAQAADAQAEAARAEAEAPFTAVRSGSTEIDIPALAERRQQRVTEDMSALPSAETGAHSRPAQPKADGETSATATTEGELSVLAAAPKPGKSRRRLYLGVGAGLAAAAAAALIIGVNSKGAMEDAFVASSGWHGSVSQAIGSGLQVCDAQGQECSAAAEDAEVPSGRVLRTDSRTQARLALSDGSEITLDRSTEVALVAGEVRHARLLSGRLGADVAKLEGKRAHIILPHGKIEVLGTKFVVTTIGDSTSVDVSRGAVKLMDERGREVVVRAGEEGRLDRGVPPYAANAPTLGESMAWTDLATPDEKEEHDIRGLGELRAKKPGETAERKGAVRLTTHRIKVRVVGQVARTEVEEVFSNQTDETLEGIFRFPIPPDANIERLALEVDGKLEEGAFVDRERAAAIWRGSIVNAAPQARKLIREEIIWVPGPWRDPALLEWQRGGRFELRIFPIPKRGSRRVILAYTQLIKPTGGVRRYIYPLAHDPSGTTEVDRFSIDLQVKGHDAQFGVRTVGYDLSDDTSKPDTSRKTLETQQFTPAGDLVVEYALPNRDQELTAWAYKPTSEDVSRDAAAAKSTPGSVGEKEASYVAIALRPKLPRASEGAQRDFAFVVDASRSMFGERYERASALAARVIRELDGDDRVTVLACDSSCRTMSGGMLPPGAETAALARNFLAAEPPEGGSDVGAAVDAARLAVPRDAGRSLRVVYIGDGTPTVGAILPAYVERWVQRSLPRGDGTVTAVAIGTDSDLDTLSAMTRGGGGVVLPYVPGQRLSEAAFAVLGATYGSSLSDVRVELPAGLTEIAPKRLDSIIAGGEQLVVARMSGDQSSGSVVLRGKLGGKDFEQRYPLNLSATSDRGNTFVPRMFAAAKIADLEQETGAAAKKEAIELSKRFDVASRFTSLLVLESPAMFKAFGLDNSRALPEWSGEEAATATGADGEVDFDDERSEGQQMAGGLPGTDHSELGASGFGSSAGAERPRSKASPSPAATIAAPEEAASPPASRPAPSKPMADLADPWNSWDRPRPPRPQPRPRRMIPMRRVFERTGVVSTTNLVPSSATPDKIAEAEREMQIDGNRRNAVKRLFDLLALSGDLERAQTVAERWSEKDPLDPEALTARADLLAQSGQRERAIRLLGSVIDARPGDVAGQQRLARLHRWAGRPEQGCRFSLAIAQIKSDDSKLLAESVRCARETGVSWMAERMLDAADTPTRAAAERLAANPTPKDALSGDFRVEATWSGDNSDLDLALLHPDGHRVSWLGAPTRSVITATDVTSTSREGLALRGAKTGEYVVEIVRASGFGPVSGRVTLNVAGKKTEIPFTLDGQRRTLGVVKISMTSRLVPVRGGQGGWR